MSRAERSLRALCGALLLGALAGCGSAPKPPPEPRLKVQAQDAEASGARHYAQGDFAAAARHFAEAARLRASVDDVTGAEHNRLQQAQAELALGRAQPALEQARSVRAPGLQMQASLLQAQALLTLHQLQQADELLGRMEAACESRCAERGRLWLLQARAHWARGRAADAAHQAQAAVPLLREQGEVLEVANAQRLLAAARLQLGEAAAALPAAQAALDIDRQHALPEKIARDWLLIGDIHRRSTGSQARFAYERALAVAQAAGLKELAELAQRSLQEIRP